MTLFVQLFIGGIAAGALLAPIAMGFSLILGVAKFWHLAHGAVILLAGYLAYVLAQQLGWPLWAVALAAPLFAALVGVALNAGLYEPLRRRGVSAIVMLIASLGAFIAINNALAIAFSFDPRVVRFELFARSWRLGEYYIDAIEITAIVFAAVAGIVTHQVLRRTRAGLSLRAVISSGGMAQVVGVDLAAARRVAFALGSALVGIPAVLIVADNGITPNAALEVVLVAAVATIVGGIGRLMGAYAGAFLVSVLQFEAAGVVSPQWGPTVVFGVLIVFILVRPTGLFGGPLWKSQV